MTSPSFAENPSLWECFLDFFFCVEAQKAEFFASPVATRISSSPMSPQDLLGGGFTYFLFSPRNLEGSRIARFRGISRWPLLVISTRRVGGFRDCDQPYLPHLLGIGNNVPNDQGPESQ